ncbi:unnamed protein product [Acanthoscelides obtectus]|uniref:Uncharacterized protein n=1 Tax=Acanthoscelides obtectus TaxID=200917 RepID=A0A9P0JG75_ACAOB|nr:unnamed protein product [Acanthoscelides obtectus]CAK1624971.1 hypothetical protein AOBTE_LOCUS2877 [Acanthoscelides obtectus]
MNLMNMLACYRYYDSPPFFLPAITLLSNFRSIFRSGHAEKCSK